MNHVFEFFNLAIFANPMVNVYLMSLELRLVLGGGGN